MANDLQTKLDAIKLDKDTNLLPENLKKGVTCLGVNGTLEGGSKPNIFVQENEPETKDGIWLECSYPVENIMAVESIFSGDGDWNLTKMSSLKAIPYNFRLGSAVSVGTNIYLFGSYSNSTQAYKYDTSTNTCTQLDNMPYGFYAGSAITVGADVYLFGSAKQSYKYNTLTDTYTQLTDTPYYFYWGSAAYIDANIYLFGGENSDSKTKVQVFTIPTNDFGNKTIVIDQGTNTNKTEIADIGIIDAKFFYNKVYYQNENGELISDIPTYNGNGTEWIQIT